MSGFLDPKPQTQAGLDGAAAALLSNPASAMRAAGNSTFVQLAPAASGGDDTANLQPLLDALETFGGGELKLQKGLYRTTGLTIGSMVALVGATEGGTIIRQNASGNHAIQSKNYATLLAANNTQSAADGTPYGIRLEDLRIEGNGPGNTGIGHGIALWAFRCTLRNVYIYNVKGDGINWGGKPGTATGAYPAGQVESVIENVWVRLAGGKGIYYYGPNDARATNLFVVAAAGAGIDTSNMDYGYVHIYGCQQGMVINGNTRIEHLETENNLKEGLVANTQGSQTNYIGRLTAYQNWTDQTATSTDYAIVLNGGVNIGDALINTSGYGGGLKITTGADHTTISSAKITGTGGGGALNGVFIAAAHAFINANVSNYTTGILSDFNHSESRTIRARIFSCPTGLYENGASSGNFYEISYKAGSSTYTPWTVAAGSKSFYNLTSYSSIVSTYIANPNGVNRNMSTLTNGEATMPRGEVQSNVTLTSGQVRLAYFTATKTETINNIKGFTASTAAAATPTLCRLGLYSVDSSGNLTLVASCASDTTMFATTTTAYTKALTVPYLKVAGQRYAIAALVITGATAPTSPASFFSGPGAEMTSTGPTESAALSGQSDLPSTITAGSLGSSSQKMYAAVTP
jgi:hypothetical protein